MVSAFEGSGESGKLSPIQATIVNRASILFSIRSYLAFSWWPLPMLPEDLPFRVIRVNTEDEVIARANNLLVGPTYEIVLFEGCDSV
jgi:hypothetical protein